MLFNLWGPSGSGGNLLWIQCVAPASLNNQEEPLQAPATHGNPPSCDSLTATQWPTCNLPPALSGTVTVTRGALENQLLFSFAKFTGAEGSRQLPLSVEVSPASWSWRPQVPLDIRNTSLLDFCSGQSVVSCSRQQSLFSDPRAPLVPQGFFKSCYPAADMFVLTAPSGGRRVKSSG